MGLLSLPKNFVWVDATHGEEIFIHAAFGFVLGFGILTARSAYKQTSVMRNAWMSKFAWLVWLELAINWGSSVYNLLALNKTIKASFGMFFGMNILWGSLTMIMLQILCNRVATIETDRRRALKITWSVFAIWLFIIISILVIWTPAKMQISPTWVKINTVWNRVEKVTYLILDVGLNTYFIRAVKSRLVDNGIHKYSRLVTFNIKLICISISVDVLLIGLMSLPQPIAYMAQIGATYIVKLNIELSLAEMLVIIAREPNITLNFDTCEKITSPRHHHPDIYRMSRTTTVNTRTVDIDGDESNPDIGKDPTVVVGAREDNHHRMEA